MANSSMHFALMLHGFDEASGCDCPTMPICLCGGVGNIGSFVPPIFVMAHGISVPISRGKPPGLSVQA